MTVSSVLIVEDVPRKFEEVRRLVTEMFPEAHVSRAETFTEGEDLIRRGNFDLLVLDISMDISPGSAGPLHLGHAILGGLDLAECMFYDDIALPTLILTGFDTFPVATEDATDVLTVADIEAKVRGHIGDNLIGCVRYGRSGWAEHFRDKVGSRWQR